MSGGLSGWRVIVTRARGEDDSLSASLIDHDAAVISFPTIEIVPAPDGGDSLRTALTDLDSYSFVIFTSKNAVEPFFSMTRDRPYDIAPKAAAVGTETARALGLAGITAELVAPRATAHDLVNSFRKAIKGERVLYCAGVKANDTIDVGLGELGYLVTRCTAYDTALPCVDPAELTKLEGATAVTFLSSSAVEGFIALAGKGRIPSVIASIGPATTATIRREGLIEACEARVRSVEGIVQALVILNSTR